MFKVGEYFVYRKDVCKVLEVKEKAYNNTDYYILSPCSDGSLKLQIPVNSDKIRKLITKKELDKIISNIPDILAIETDVNDKLIESKYRDLLNLGTHEGLIKIIKTTYLRNKERLDNNKKTGDRDNSYLKLAEGYLYNEFSIVLNMNYDDTKQYIIDKVSKLVD